MPAKKKLVSSILLTAGILMIAVPSVLTYLNTKRNDALIEDFLQQSEQAVSETDALADEDVETFYIPEAADDSDLETSSSEEASPASETVPSASGSNQTVNEKTGTGTRASAVPTSTPRPKKALLSKEEIRKRMTGVLIIKKINVRMVVMDGVDEETLRVAAGRMPNTGKIDEIGNCVLAGHRSYTLGKYFNRLDELEPGDKITIQTADKTLNYEVTKKFIVEPTDLSITAGNGTDKILTLFTCHPVAIATHRLVVQAKQID